MSVIEDRREAQRAGQRVGRGEEDRVPTEGLLKSDVPGTTWRSHRADPDDEGSSGAAEVLGVDTDPIAAEATLANARRNRLVRKVQARHGTLPVAESPFDVVLANLITSVLVHSP